MRELGDQDLGRPPTTQSFVLQELRSWLISGEVAPGSRIHQEALAERLGVSRHPVREALQILKGEGQVAYIPQRGYYVADLDPAELHEIYLLREVLENKATELATPLLNTDDIDALEAIYDEIDSAMARDDIAALMAANRRFHFRLLTPCGLSRLMRLVSQLWDQSNPYRFRHFGEVANREISQREHRLMLDAARAGDTERLIKLSDQHRAHAVPTLKRTIGREQQS
ncbi:GntR family transcriptional regulator [Mycobacterium sp. NPDC003449]